MADLKKLQERSSEIVARMDSVRLIESQEPDKIAERDLELESLIKESSDISKKISFEQSVLEAIKTSRSVVERCTPAPTEIAKTRIAPVSRNMKLRAFENVDDAYAAGKWLQGYVFRGSNSQEARNWCEEHGVDSRAMGSTGATTGNPFVPDLLSSTVIRLVDQYSVFATNARNIPMGSDVVLFPRRTGGTTAAWLSENSASTPADAASDQITLTAKKVVASVVSANELFQDAPMVADWLATELALSLSNAIETAAFNGVVGNAPLVDGINLMMVAGSNATYAASLTVTGATIDAPEELTKAHFLSLVAKLPAYAKANAKWYMSPYTHALSVMNLDLAQGGSLGLSAGGTFTFLGYPVILTDQMPSTGDLTGFATVLLADLNSSSLYGIRKSIEIAQSSDVNFLSDQTVVRAVARVGIKTHSVGTSSVAGPIQAIVCG